MQTDVNEIFKMNVTPMGRLAVYGLIEHDRFSTNQVHSTLEDILQRKLQRSVSEQILSELRLSGFVREDGVEFAWALPILREALRRHDPKAAQIALLEELLENPGQGDLPQVRERSENEEAPG